MCLFIKGDMHTYMCIVCVIIPRTLFCFFLFCWCQIFKVGLDTPTLTPHMPHTNVTFFKKCLSSNSARNWLRPTIFVAFLNPTMPQSRQLYTVIGQVCGGEKICGIFPFLSAKPHMPSRRGRLSVSICTTHHISSHLTLYEGRLFTLLWSVAF